MKINLLVVLSIMTFSQISFAQNDDQIDETKCAYKCIVNKTILGNKLKPLGGYTADMNTYCIYKGIVNDVKVKAAVSDSFGNSTQLALEVDGTEVSSSGPKNSGQYSISLKGMKLSCVR